MSQPINTVVKPYIIEEVKPLSFIFEIQNALNPSICQEVIRRFEEDKTQQYEGRIGQIATKDQSIKISTDLVASGKED